MEWNLLGGLMPPAVDTAEEKERRHSGDSGNASQGECEALDQDISYAKDLSLENAILANFPDGCDKSFTVESKDEDSYDIVPKNLTFAEIINVFNQAVEEDNYEELDKIIQNIEGYEGRPITLVHENLRNFCEQQLSLDLLNNQHIYSNILSRYNFDQENFECDYSVKELVLLAIASNDKLAEKYQNTLFAEENLSLLSLLVGGQKYIEVFVAKFRGIDGIYDKLKNQAIQLDEFSKIGFFSVIALRKEQELLNAVFVEYVLRDFEQVLKTSRPDPLYGVLETASLAKNEEFIKVVLNAFENEPTKKDLLKASFATLLETAISQEHIPTVEYLCKRYINNRDYNIYEQAFADDKVIKMLNQQILKNIEARDRKEIYNLILKTALDAGNIAFIERLCEECARCSNDVIDYLDQKLKGNEFDNAYESTLIALSNTGNKDIIVTVLAHIQIYQSILHNEQVIRQVIQNILKNAIHYSTDQEDCSLVKEICYLCTEIDEINVIFQEECEIFKSSIKKRIEGLEKKEKLLQSEALHEYNYNYLPSVVNGLAQVAHAGYDIYTEDQKCQEDPILNRLMHISNILQFSINVQEYSCHERQGLWDQMYSTPGTFMIQKKSDNTAGRSAIPAIESDVLSGNSESKSTDNQQLQSSIVDEGKNIIANKKASEEAMVKPKESEPDSPSLSSDDDFVRTSSSSNSGFPFKVVNSAYDNFNLLHNNLLGSSQPGTGLFKQNDLSKLGSDDFARSSPSIEVANNEAGIPILVVPEMAEFEAAASTSEMSSITTEGAKAESNNINNKKEEQASHLIANEDTQFQAAIDVQQLANNQQADCSSTSIHAESSVINSTNSQQPQENVDERENIINEAARDEQEVEAETQEQEGEGRAVRVVKYGMYSSVAVALASISRWLFTAEQQTSLSQGSDNSAVGFPAVHHIPISPQVVLESKVNECSKTFKNARKSAKNNFGISKDYPEPQWYKDLHKSETSEVSNAGASVATLNKKVLKETTSNNYRRGKMPKNIKTIEEKLSDSIDNINLVGMIHLLEKVDNSIYESTLQKLLGQANDKIANLEEGGQKETLAQIIVFLKKELEHTAAESLVCDDTASSQEVPVVDPKESSPSLSSEDDDYSRLESDKSAGSSSSFEVIDNEAETSITRVPEMAEFESAETPSVDGNVSVLRSNEGAAGNGDSVNQTIHESQHSTGLFTHDSEDFTTPLRSSPLGFTYQPVHESQHSTTRNDENLTAQFNRSDTSNVKEPSLRRSSISEDSYYSCSSSVKSGQLTRAHSDSSIFIEEEDTFKELGRSGTSSSQSSVLSFPETENDSGCSEDLIFVNTRAPNPPQFAEDTGQIANEDTEATRAASMLAGAAAGFLGMAGIYKAAKHDPLSVTEEHAATVPESQSSFDNVDNHSVPYTSEAELPDDNKNDVDASISSDQGQSEIPADSEGVKDDATVLSIDGDEEEQQSAEREIAHENTQPKPMVNGQNGNENDRNVVLQSTKGTTVTTWMFAITGILAVAAAPAAYFALGTSLLVAGAVAGIGAFCIIAAIAIHYYNKSPSDSLAKPSAEAAIVNDVAIGIS